MTATQRSPRVTATLLLLLVFLLPGPALANSIAGKGDSYPPSRLADDPQQAKKVRQGEYLVKLADCMACHTAPGGMPFAGGIKIDTPFGTLYTPNITPDDATGIGNWSDDDFVRALREGIRPDGSYYYPVFPYNYFSKMSREQVLAIRAYLGSIPAVKKANRSWQLDWPFNYRILQFGWRLLYFDSDDSGYTAASDKPAAWNRGAFIVEGPGHCALCHTRLNLLGVPERDYYLAGSFVEGYYAPDITARGLENLNDAAIARIFSDDLTPQDTPLSGPMAEVEHNSLRYLSHSDALALASYLKSVSSASPPLEDTGGKPLGQDAGRKLYLSSCKACHAISSVGAPEIDNASAWDNLLNQGKERLWEIAIHGDGAMPPKGGCSPCSDARVKAAVDYMIETATRSKPAAPGH